MEDNEEGVEGAGFDDEKSLLMSQMSLEKKLVNHVGQPQVWRLSKISRLGHGDLGIWRGSKYGKGIIIRVINTCITPYHPSYSDSGIGPPPKKWKGKCEVAGCNNKLIGVWSFITNGTGSIFDEEGHGTHTSITAARNFVVGANALGNYNGTAAGMAPFAHLAMYKVCDENG
ncbi:subtilase family protein [Artemisia annua]|uniref:Subtilase family protein n=1 Tax=Artemisia annua TaxID=35608 RepID=A0A2U1P593_ARTAN|nr:subtilase family protein [Artemisia annua]